MKATVCLGFHLLIQTLVVEVGGEQASPDCHNVSVSKWQVDGFTYLGCFKPSCRLKKDSFDNSNMTTTYCTTECANRSFIYAGLSNGTRCECSNSNCTGPAGRDCEKWCGIPCGGNRDQQCGGQTHIQVYKVLGDGTKVKQAAAPIVVAVLMLFLVCIATIFLCNRYKNKGFQSSQKSSPCVTAVESRISSTPGTNLNEDGGNFSTDNGQYDHFQRAGVAAFTTYPAVIMESEEEYSIAENPRCNPRPLESKTSNQTKSPQSPCTLQDRHIAHTEVQTSRSIQSSLSNASISTYDNRPHRSKMESSRGSDCSFEKGAFERDGERVNRERRRCASPERRSRGKSQNYYAQCLRATGKPTADIS
ncbi:uncharacterized protein [Diadema antillarum]|uniref:uncharacterized protein n=1 Tax=Diadema antillarum TaxID=105358 RepID=UPI003A85811D